MKKGLLITIAVLVILALVGSYVYLSQKSVKEKKTEPTKQEEEKKEEEKTEEELTAEEKEVLEKQKNDRLYTGMVKKIEAGSIVIDREGEEITATIDVNTDFQKGEGEDLQPGSSSEVKVGMTVNVLVNPENKALAILY